MSAGSEGVVSVVTGASGGIGRWIALGLAQAGHRVVMVCRDASRGAAAAEWIRGEVPGAAIEVVLADLSSLAETHRVGRAIALAHPRIGVLVNNAGVFTARREVTTEGRELVLAVNHLSPHVLADALEGSMRAAAAAWGEARIVNLGSSTSDRARVNPGALELSRRWGMVRAYGGSKLAMMMSTFARAERLAGSGVSAVVVHPGMVATGLIRERGAIGLAWRLLARFSLTEAQGADSPVQAAVGAAWAGVSGVYIKKRVVVRPNRRALDAALVCAVEGATRGLIARTLG